MSIEDFDDYCVNFAAKNLYLLRLSGIGKIQEAKRKKRAGIDRKRQYRQLGEAFLRLPKPN